MITAVFKGADIDELERLREDFAAGASRSRLFDATIAAMRARHDYLAGTVAYEELEAATQEESRLLHQTGSRARRADGRRLPARPRCGSRATSTGTSGCCGSGSLGYESLEDARFLANVLGELGLVARPSGDVAAATDALERARRSPTPTMSPTGAELDALEAYICAPPEPTRMRPARCWIASSTLGGIELVALDGRADYLRARPSCG